VRSQNARQQRRLWEKTVSGHGCGSCGRAPARLGCGSGGGAPSTLLTFSHDDPVFESEELHEVAEFLKRARTGWLPPLPRDLVERLARQGFVAEPAPPPLGNLRYRLRHVKTGQVLGIRGYIWSRQEIERMVEIWEDYERRMRESEADGGGYEQDDGD
jgi:hypothetical protein